MVAQKRGIDIDEMEWVLEQISSGMTLREVKAMANGPGAKRINFEIYWNPKFEEQVKKAREHGAQELFDQAKEIAFDDSQDILRDATGVYIFNRVSVPRAKLKVDTLMKQAAIRNRELSERTKVEVEDITDYGAFAAAAAARVNREKAEKEDPEDE